MSIEIRTFQPSDEKAVIQLWKDCGLVVPENDPARDIQRKQKEHMDLFLVAVERGQVIGAVMGGYDGHRGAVNYLATTPSHQHRGVAKVLMAELEQKLSALGCPKINLYVRITNQAVKTFYEKLGYLSNDHSVSMGKRLVDDGLNG